MTRTPLSCLPRYNYAWLLFSRYSNHARQFPRTRQGIIYLAYLVICDLNWLVVGGRSPGKGYPLIASAQPDIRREVALLG